MGHESSSLAAALGGGDGSGEASLWFPTVTHSRMHTVSQRSLVAVRSWPSNHDDLNFCHDAGYSTAVTVWLFRRLIRVRIWSN